MCLGKKTSKERIEKQMTIFLLRRLILSNEYTRL